MKDSLDGLDATAAVIGGGTALAVRLATRWLDLPYPILHDPDRMTYEAYGFERLLGLYQQSGAIVVGPDGRILFAHRGANPQKALPAGEILEVLSRHGGRPA